MQVEQDLVLTQYNYLGVLLTFFSSGELQKEFRDLDEEYSSATFVFSFIEAYTQTPGLHDNSLLFL